MGQAFVQSIGLSKRRTLISMPNQILVEVFLPKQLVNTELFK